MLPASARDSLDADNTSLASSSPKTLHTSPPRKLSTDNETNATKVFVRVRPFSAAERRQSGSGDPPAIVAVSEDNPCHITTLDPSKQYQPKSTYAFDRCFNSASIAAAAGEDARLLLQDGKDVSAVPLSTLEDVAAESQLNPLQLACLTRDQAAVYGHVGRPVLLNALSGYNGCVFAYGQTGSGKTYTMMGPPGTLGASVTSVAANTNTTPAAAAAAAGGVSATPAGKKFRRAATGYTSTSRTGPHSTSGTDDAGDSRFQSYSSMTPRTTFRASPMECEATPRRGGGGEKTPKGGAARAPVEEDEGLQGIVPRLVRDLFAELHLKRERDSSHSFRVEVEYYEIYREKVMDLLGSHSAGTNAELRVRQSKTSGPYVENLRRRHVEDERQIFRLLRQGNQRRHTASTAMNDRSSRSHAIFVLHMVQMRITDQDSTSTKVTSKVNLVDLAGSERTGAHNAEGDQFREGVVINISLTVLGRVIDALADKSQGKRTVFCPYRDSVLTWLLMDSLGGNSKTTMVATVSPHCTNFEEVCQTLRYASRAKQIVTKVVVNEDPQVRQIKLLTAEVQQLKGLLLAEGKAADNDEDVEALQDRIHALEVELNDTRNELEEKAAELASLQAIRRITSTLPTTLKACNAGAAGAAKELSKAKSDLRRLEAENLLHLQTEEELQRAVERVKAVEQKYAQLLSESRESQEATRKLEREKTERDRRILELQRQLSHERAKGESPQAGSSRTLSPSGVSVQPFAVAKTTTTTAVTPTAVMSSSLSAASSTSLDRKAATCKSTPRKKAVGRTTLKSLTPATTAAGDARRESAGVDSEAERRELCARQEEETSALTLQLQERTDAYRKSQLEVKRLRLELKSAQETLQTVEKRMSDHHADAVRRLQKEVQETRRTLKEERKGNKDVRQVMSGPVKDRPVFCLAFVASAVTDSEATHRRDLLDEETRCWTQLQQRAHAAKVAAEEHGRAVEALADLRTRHRDLEKTYGTLVERSEGHEAAIATLTAELEDARLSHVEATEAHYEEVTKLEEQLGALRILNEEQHNTAAEQETRARELRAEVESLRSQLQQEAERYAKSLADVTRGLAEKTSAFEAVAATAANLRADHAQQLEKLHREHAAVLTASASQITLLECKLKEAAEELQSVERAHATEAQRRQEEARQHERALADVQARLAAESQSSAQAATAHEAARRTLEETLEKLTAEAAAEVARLQQLAEERERTLDAQAADNDATQCDLRTQLNAAKEETRRSEEARKTLIQRSVEEASVHAEELTTIAERLQAAERASTAAATAHGAQIHQLRTEHASAAKRNAEERDALSQQVVDFRSQLAAAEEIRTAEARHRTEAIATLEASVESLRRELAEEQTAHTALTAENEKALAEQQTKHSVETEAAATRHATELAALQEQLDCSHAKLSKSEEARKHQIQRSLEQAAAHTQELEEVRAQLSAARTSATDAAAAYTAQVRELERKLRDGQAASASAAAQLQQHLKAAQLALQEEQAKSSQATAAQEETLGVVREDLRRSEEARKALIQRSLEQAAAHVEESAALREELRSSAAAIDSVRREHESAVQELSAKLLREQEEGAEERDALRKQVADLQVQLTTVEKTHTADAQSSAEVIATLEASLAALRSDLAKEQAAQTARNAEHETALAEQEKAHSAQTEDAAARYTVALLSLQQQLGISQAELHKSEEARKRQIQCSIEHATAQEEQLTALREKLHTAQRDATAAATAHEAEIQQLRSEHADTVRLNTDVHDELGRQLADLKTQLEREHESREAAAQQNAEALAARDATEAELRAALAAAASAAAKQLEQHQSAMDALQQQHQAVEAGHKTQLVALQEEARATAAASQAQLVAKEDQLRAAAQEKEALLDRLSKSEQSRRSATEKSLADAAEHRDILAALQCRLEAAQADAAAANAAHATALQEAASQLEQKTATSDAAAAALHKELELQRQATAAQAVLHTRAAKELEDRLVAALHAAEVSDAAHTKEQERAAKVHAEQASTVAHLEARLEDAERAARAAKDADAATLQQVRADLTAQCDASAAAVTALQQKLRHTQAKLMEVEQTIEVQAKEGMQHAEAHTRSLESLQRMLEASHKQKVTALSKSHADRVSTLEAQLATQTAVVQSLDADLRDSRSQTKQMAETQNYFHKQLESEKASCAELRTRVESAEKARAASAVKSEQLQHALTASETAVETLTESLAERSRELQVSQEVIRSQEAALASQVSEAAQQRQQIAQQTSDLAAARTASEELAKEVADLQAEKARLLQAQEDLIEQQREQLMTQQVDTVTELETQFRAMEKERLALVDKARQTEESLRATIEKQQMELRQMREDLDFNMSMNHFEASDARRGSAITAGAPIRSASGAPVTATPSVGSGMAPSVFNTGLASRPALPAMGTSVTGGVAGMLSSFFRRSTSGVMPSPSTAAAASTPAMPPRGPSPVVQRRSSVAEARAGGGGGESRHGATTPVRRGSNFYSTAAYRPSSPSLSLFGKAGATGNSSSGAAGVGMRAVSNASMDAYLVNPPAALGSPVEERAPQSLLPPK